MKSAVLRRELREFGELGESRHGHRGAGGGGFVLLYYDFDESASSRHLEFSFDSKGLTTWRA